MKSGVREVRVGHHLSQQAFRQISLRWERRGLNLCKGQCFQMFHPQFVLPAHQ